MAAAIEITREDWARETERLCPSGLAYSAYVALEQFIVDNTDLNVTYHYINYSSDDPFRDYDRNRVSLGLTATF